MGHARNKYTRAYFHRAAGTADPTRPRDAHLRLLERIDPQGKRVLDLGAGQGAAARHMLDRGAERVVAVDFSAAACEPARALLEGSPAEVVCEDALVFLTEANDHLAPEDRFDIVLMLDFIEHVPRHELEDLLERLKPRLAPRAVIVVNTPVYTVDNDVLANGLNPEAREADDDDERTFGLRCNRYTLGSLLVHLASQGYRSVSRSGHFFIHVDGRDVSPTWDALDATGFPIVHDPGYADEYEHAQLAVESTRPPAADPPEWRQITAGRLEGRQILLPLEHDWQRELLDGTLDHALFDSIADLDLEGALVLDVGGYIGYHALSFASRVGETGAVATFEPNHHNAERLQINLARNPDLAERIQLVQAAAGDSVGTAEFVFSDDVDGGPSSGSFVAGGDTPYGEEVYDFLHFKHTQVAATTIDTFVAERTDDRIPKLIKIDVEGAEHRVLQGARHLIANHRPVVLIELHGIAVTLEVLAFFAAHAYEVEFLEELSENRAFAIARPNQHAVHDPLRSENAHRSAMTQLVTRATSAIRHRDEELARLSTLAGGPEDTPADRELARLRAINSLHQRTIDDHELRRVLEGVTAHLNRHDPTNDHTSTPTDNTAQPAMSPDDVAGALRAIPERVERIIEAAVARERLARERYREQFETSVARRMNRRFRDILGR